MSRRPDNPTRKRFRGLSVLLAAAAKLATTLVAVPAQAVGGVRDPIKEMPAQSQYGLTLSEYASFPTSTPTPAPTDQRLNRVARLNTIMEVPDGSGRRAVPDLNGNLYFVKDGRPSVYLDVAATFAPQFFSGRGLGQGFGYVAFDPEFRTNGKFYTIHTEDAAKATAVPDYAQPRTIYQGVINEWTATDPSADTFSGTRREILRIGFAGQVHGIQEINFNPTAEPGDPDYRKLYLAVGDGGMGYQNSDPQNLAMPHGKLLRIDPSGNNAPNGKYGIPPTIRSPHDPGRSVSSTPSASVTPTASAGTATPVGRTSVTSANTPSRPSTRCAPATTSAGASARAPSSSTSRKRIRATS